MSVDSDSDDEAKAHAEAVARGKEAAIAERSGRNVDNAEALLALAEELEKEETNVLSETSHDVSSISSHETKHSPEKEPNSSSTEPSSSTDTDDVPHPRFRRQQSARQVTLETHPVRQDDDEHSLNDTVSSPSQDSAASSSGSTEY